MSPGVGARGIKVGMPSLALSEIFAPVDAPPAVSDPTGGLLGFVITPINFVVTGAEEAVLTAMADAIVLLEIGLRSATDGARAASYIAFRDIYGAISAAVDTAKNSIASAGGDAVTDVEGAAAAAISAAQSALNDALGVVYRLLTDIKIAVERGGSDVEEKVKEVIAGARQRVGAILETDLREASLAVTGAVAEALRTLRRTASQAENRLAAAVRPAEGAVVALSGRMVMEIRAEIDSVGSAVRDIGARARALRGRAATEIGMVRRAIDGVAPNITEDAQRGAAGTKAGMDSIASSVGYVYYVGPILAIGAVIVVLYAASRLYYGLVLPRIQLQARRNYGALLPAPDHDHAHPNA